MKKQQPMPRRFECRPKGRKRNFYGILWNDTEYSVHFAKWYVGNDGVSFDQFVSDCNMFRFLDRAQGPTQ